MVEELEYLGKRFQGVDLQFRRDGTNWPKPWKTVVSGFAPASPVA